MNHHFRYAKTVGAKHFHTSAKLNKGIEEMFFELSKRECSIVASWKMVIIYLDACMVTVRLIDIYLMQEETK